jgi:hypothetical protein
MLPIIGGKLNGVGFITVLPNTNEEPLVGGKVGSEIL